MSSRAKKQFVKMSKDLSVKVKLINRIQDIREKITEEEYTDILSLLRKIKIDYYGDGYYNEDNYVDEIESEEDNEEDDVFDRVDAIIKSIRLPDKEVKLWDGKNFTDINLKDIQFTSVHSMPARVSSELAYFLGIPEDVHENTYITDKTIIMRKITNHVKMHDLQDEKNRRVIKLNKPGGEALKFLNVPDDKELTFFNAISFIKPHIINLFRP